MKATTATDSGRLGVGTTIAAAAATTPISVTSPVLHCFLACVCINVPTFDAVSPYPRLLHLLGYVVHDAAPAGYPYVHAVLLLQATA